MTQMRRYSIKGMGLGMNAIPWLHFKMVTTTCDREKYLKLATLP